MEHENCLGILLTKKGTELYIIKPIGEGATSIVYLALDKDNKEFAVKLYKNSESYINEVSRLRSLNPSKYIVKLISCGQGHLERGYSYYTYKLFNHFDSDQVNYVIFEYLKNGELYNYIFLLKKKFSEEISRKIFFDLLKAIEACHKSGITHGDIKLQNILLNSNFNLKLIDFGFAKNIKDGLISEITGTRFYNAPEMFSCATIGYDGVIKDFNGFWKKCEQKMSNNIGISNEFKDLFEKMVCYQPKERIGINDIKGHPWLKELIKNIDNNQDEKANFNKNNNTSDNKKLFSPKKNKVKYLSHNPSFYKLDKNNYNKISNFSDGFNQVHVNENNLLHINYNESNNENTNYLSNYGNNKAKEFEIKYLKELSLRKIKIDMILKEQEDDAD